MSLPCAVVVDADATPSRPGFGLQETALRFSQQALSAQQALIELYSRTKWMCVAIVVVFFVVMAGGAGWWLGFKYGWNGTIPNPLRIVVGWWASVLGNING